MKGARAFLLSTCLAAGSAMMMAQDADALRRADSLTREWDVLWRRSDSLRVEAMFMRMRADSIRRQATRPSASNQQGDMQVVAGSTLPAPRDSAMAIDSVILLRARQGKTPRGVTLSDTLTARTLLDEPEVGVASYYAEKFHGRPTSSGEKFNMNDRTCAHRWLPFGTKLRVTNLRNDRSVVVRVNDRGPWKHGRLLDVSKAAAIDLDMMREGTARVRIEVVRDADSTLSD